MSFTTNGVYGPEAVKEFADSLRRLADRLEREARDPDSNVSTLNYEMKRDHSKRFDTRGRLEGLDPTHERITIDISFRIRPAYYRERL